MTAYRERSSTISYATQRRFLASRFAMNIDNDGVGILPQLCSGQKSLKSAKWIINGRHKKAPHHLANRHLAPVGGLIQT